MPTKLRCQNCSDFRHGATIFDRHTVHTVEKTSIILSSSRAQFVSSMMRLRETYAVGTSTEAKRNKDQRRSRWRILKTGDSQSDKATSVQRETLLACWIDLAFGQGSSKGGAAHLLGLGRSELCRIMNDLYANGLERVLWCRILVRVFLLEVCCILLLGWRVERHLDFGLTGEVGFRCGVTGWAESLDGRSHWMG